LLKLTPTNNSMGCIILKQVYEIFRRLRIFWDVSGIFLNFVLGFVRNIKIFLGFVKIVREFQDFFLIFRVFIRMFFLFVPEPSEGTNSPRLFTPGETKALAKSKVHQISRVTVRGWSSSLISKIWRTVMNSEHCDWSNLKFAL
jgi:hypothetical protein